MHIHTFKNTCMNTCTYAHTCVHIHAHAHAYMQIYIYTQELIESYGLDELLINVSSVYSSILIFGVD